MQGSVKSCRALRRAIICAVQARQAILLLGVAVAVLL